MGTPDTRAGRCWVVAFAALTLTLATPALAQEGSPSRADAVLRKLGRGLMNIGSCPAELIRVPMLVDRESGHLAAMSVGVLQGAWRTIVRGAAGVFEVATFYAEIPPGYKPLVHPEFVWAHGDWAE